MAVLCLYGSTNAYKMTLKMSNPTFKQSITKKVTGAIVASALLLSSVGGFVGPAMAAVGEGDLPPGAMAFQKLLKYQV